MLCPGSHNTENIVTLSGSISQNIHCVRFCLEYSTWYLGADVIRTKTIHKKDIIFDIFSWIWWEWHFVRVSSQIVINVDSTISIHSRKQIENKLESTYTSQTQSTAFTMRRWNELLIWHESYVFPTCTLITIYYSLLDHYTPHLKWKSSWHAHYAGVHAKK